MKHKILLGAMLFFLLGFGAGGCSKKESPAKADQIKGSVVSVDTAKHEVVIKDKEGNAATVIINSGKIAMLKEGEKIRVQMKPGSNVVESIKFHGLKKNEAKEGGEEKDE